MIENELSEMVRGRDGEIDFLQRGKEEKRFDFTKRERGKEI